MKKSLIFLGLLALGTANAQQKGAVGINTNAPKATLEITPNADNAVATATTNEGILAPRLTKSRVANIAKPVQGTLVYVLDENTTDHPNSLISSYTGSNATVAKITEKGYYFYNGAEWVKASSTGGSTNSGVNIYTQDGTLTSARTVSQAGNKLIFNTGESAETVLIGTENVKKPAELEVQGSLRNTGAHYVKVTPVTGTTYTVKPDDYYIAVNGSTNEVVIILPFPAEAKGRLIILSNKTSQNLVMRTPDNQQALDGTESVRIPKDRAETIISDGTKWFNLINY